MELCWASILARGAQLSTVSSRTESCSAPHEWHVKRWGQSQRVVKDSDLEAAAPSPALHPIDSKSSAGANGTQVKQIWCGHKCLDGQGLQVESG